MDLTSSVQEWITCCTLTCEDTKSGSRNHINTSSYYPLTNHTPLCNPCLISANHRCRLWPDYWMIFLLTPFSQIFLLTPFSQYYKLCSCGLHNGLFARWELKLPFFAREFTIYRAGLIVVPRRTMELFLEVFLIYWCLVSPMKRCILKR